MKTFSNFSTSAKTLGHVKFLHRHTLSFFPYSKLLWCCFCFKKLHTARVHWDFTMCQELSELLMFWENGKEIQVAVGIVVKSKVKNGRGHPSHTWQYKSFLERAILDISDPFHTKPGCTWRWHELMLRWWKMTTSWVLEQVSYRRPTTYLASRCTIHVVLWLGFLQQWVRLHFLTSFHKHRIPNPCQANNHTEQTYTS